MKHNPSKLPAGHFLVLGLIPSADPKEPLRWGIFGGSDEIDAALANANEWAKGRCTQTVVVEVVQEFAQVPSVLALEPPRTSRAWGENVVSFPRHFRT